MKKLAGNIKKCGCCKGRYRKKCPQHETECDGIKCKQRRREIALNDFDDESGLLYTYVPENVTYETAINQCKGLGFGYRLATINEVNRLAHLFNYFDDNDNKKRCPTLVWSKDESEEPVIIRIMPCNGEQMKIMWNYDVKKCKVQRICVVDPD